MNSSCTGQDNQSSTQNKKKKKKKRRILTAKYDVLKEFWLSIFVYLI